jgi:hypothetical protein
MDMLISKGTTMMIKNSRTLLLLAALCSGMLIYSPHGCKNPSQYEPLPDTLCPPPGRPQLLDPIDHYVFMDPDALPGSSFYIEVELNWDTVANAEIYEIELITDDLPANIIHCTTNYWIFIIHNDTTKLCDYQWRVRAGSVHWETMTEWSEQRHFEARWRPFGPQLLSPANYSIINIDSLPSLVELTWNPVSDEEYYEIKVLIDTLLVDDNFAFTTTYSCLVEDTALYSWQIRAASPLWQYFSFPSASWYFFVHLNK